MCAAVLQKALLDLCVSYGIPIMADEVYQENVWAANKSFTSFRKVALDNEMRDAVVFSLHSISKGFMGECGHRCERPGSDALLSYPAALVDM